MASRPPRDSQWPSSAVTSDHANSDGSPSETVGYVADFLRDAVPVVEKVGAHCGQWGEDIKSVGDSFERGSRAVIFGTRCLGATCFTLWLAWTFRRPAMRAWQSRRVVK